VKLSKERDVNSFALKYLNRLSDAFFVIARLLARESSTEEQLWKHEKATKE
jgi:cob(I)alamin adenosyltransferase